MEELLDLLLSGGLRPPIFHPDIVALERALPRSDTLALMLLRRGGELTMSELADRLGAPLSTVTGVGIRLARKRLVRRDRHPDDRRVVRLRLTPKGQALAKELEKHVAAVVRRVHDALNEEEQDQLISLLFKVAAALRTSPTPEPKTTDIRRIPIE